MKSDVSVNTDVDNPKRLNKNILKYLKNNAWFNKLEDFKEKNFSAKMFVNICPLIQYKICS